MDKFIFTRFKEVDMKILSELESLSHISKVNKNAVEICNDKIFWTNLLKLNNIYLIDNYTPQNFDEWLKYYKYNYFQEAITMKHSTFAYSTEFNEIDKAFNTAENIIIISSMNTYQGYSEFVVDLRLPNYMPMVYKMMKNLFYVKLHFDKVYNFHKKLIFVFSNNQYYIFIRSKYNKLIPIEEYVNNDGYQYMKSNSYKIQVTREEFKELLAMVIYERIYYNISDHKQSSFAYPTKPHETPNANVQMLNLLTHLKSNNMFISKF